MGAGCEGPPAVFELLTGGLACGFAGLAAVDFLAAFPLPAGVLACGVAELALEPFTLAGFFVGLFLELATASPDLAFEAIVWEFAVGTAGSFDRECFGSKDPEGKRGGRSSAGTSLYRYVFRAYLHTPHHAAPPLRPPKVQP